LQALSPSGDGITHPENGMTAAPDYCPDHLIQLEHGDSCYFCLRNQRKASELAERIRQHPSEAYKLSADSSAVMMYHARHIDDPSLYAACAAANGEAQPTVWPDDLPPLPGLPR
jgi:hypothetical protein